MKQKDRCLPLEVVNGLGWKYPGCWDKIESLRRDNGSILPEWPQSVYIPISGTIAVVTNGAPKVGMLPMEILNDACAMAACAPWRKSKTIYRFDPDLAAELMENAEDIVVPTDILDRMPYQCIYIDVKCDDISGFFVHKDFDFRKNVEELRFVLVSEDGTCSTLRMEICQGKTFFDSLNETYRQDKKGFGYMDAIALEAGAIMRYSQLVLYLCAENREVSENPTQAKIYKKRSSVHDVIAEVRKWDVGVRTGSAIRRVKLERKTKEEPGESDTESQDHEAIPGKRKRPHARRAHWHHYRVGKGKKDLILKWTPPTFINADLLEDGDTPAVIHSVKE